MGAEGPTRVSRLRNFLGLERNVNVMLGATLLLGMGEELWTDFVPKALEVLGASGVGVGIYGTLQDGLDALYPYPGGVLTDRLGRPRALVLFTGLTIVGYAIYLVAPTWWLFLPGLLFAMVWSSLSLPAIFAIIGDSLPTTRRAMGFAVQSILKRIPRVISPPIGGALILAFGVLGGVRAGLAVTIALAVLSVWVQRRYYVDDKPVSRQAGPGLRVLLGEMPPALRHLLLADSLVRFGERLAGVFIVLYVINVMAGSALDFGLLRALQMLTSILLYIPVARLADRRARKPFVLVTYLAFTLFPLALAVAPDAWWLVPAFVVGGFREFGEPARKATIVDLAPEGQRGSAVGAFYLVRGMATLPASLLGGVLWAINPRLPFIAATAIAGLGTLSYALARVDVQAGGQPQAS